MPLRRAGFSLAEVIVSIALTVLIGSLAFRLLAFQQRFFREAHADRESASRKGEIESILSSELRLIAPITDSLRMMMDSAVEALSVIGSSVACNGLPAADSALKLVPAELLSGNVLSAFLYPPDTADILQLFVPDSARGSWTQHSISRVSTGPASTVCPTTSGFTSPLDAQASSYILYLRDQPTQSARGAVVRLLRRGRFSHYKSSDGNWYLGYKRCQSLTCSAVQPVAGPLLPHRATGPSGLRFSFHDPSGAATANPSAVSAIAVVMRTNPLDSLKTTIAPRNRH